MTESGISPNSIELPCDCGDTNEIPPAGLVQLARPPAPFRNGTTVGPQVAGHPTTLYTLGSNRSRYQIIRDYARRHNLTVSAIDQLVRALPDYGAQSMLAGSVAALNVSAEIINLAAERAARADRARRR